MGDDEAVIPGLGLLLSNALEEIMNDLRSNDDDLFGDDSDHESDGEDDFFFQSKVEALNQGLDTGANRPESDS